MNNKTHNPLLVAVFIFFLLGPVQFVSIGAATAQGNSDSAAQTANNASIQEALDQLRKSNALPFPVPMMMQPPPYKELEPNTVIEEFPAETRVAMLQNMAAANPWSLRQVFNFMTLKMKANEDLSFDDVIEAMDSRAVEENLKRSGHNMVWKEVEAKTGKPTPRFEILQYCDALVARMVLDYSPEFSIFLPCRITVLEDAVGDIWLMTLDWDVSWLSFVWHPDSQLDEELKDNGRRIRNAMVSIMEAGAAGEW
ncbi:MAG: DUF302 domain-containing protein [bacterium]